MQLDEFFEKVFGSAPEAIYSAAGRVNLIGEHVDYCGGKVLPAALSLKCRVAVRRNGTNFLRVAATDIPARAEIDLNATENYKDLKWGNYQAGVADVMRKEGYSLVGCDILYDCSVPFGSGLSSSAAIEVATAYALARMSGEVSVDKVKLAVLCQRAENEYCGVNCGIMDQFASANGKKEHAVLLDCTTLEFAHIPLDLNGYVLVIANCNKPHNLIESKYNERRSEVETALRLLQRRLPVKSLAQLLPYQLEEYRSLLPNVVYRRARHVVTECERVNRSVAALARNELSAFGQFLNDSHLSLRDDYEVTGKELDALAEAAWDRKECLGSRMTGAGFGGCTVSLVKKDGVETFVSAVGEKYREKIGYPASFYVADIADGIVDEEYAAG